MLVGEWDFEREKEVARQEARQEGWQEAEQYYGTRLQTASAQLQTEKTASAQYKAQLQTVSAQYKSQIQALQEEIRKLRERL